MAVVPSSKKVLIIDDEEPIVELISEILHKYGYEPIAVTRWTEALDAITHENPDVILLDLKMPTVTGSSMLEFLREEGITVPVIIVSGFVTDDVARELSEHGISGIVKKPFQATQLRAEIERALATEPPPPSAEQPLPAAPVSDDARASAAPSDGSVDDLYDRPPEPAPEPVSAPDADPVPTMDILYSLPSDEASSAPPSSGRSPTDEEALQILRKLNPDAVPDGARSQEDSPSGVPPPPADEGDALRALQNFTPASPSPEQPGNQGGSLPQTPAFDSGGGAVEVPQSPASPPEERDTQGVPPPGPPAIDNLPRHIPPKADASPVPPPPSGTSAEPNGASDREPVSLDNPLYEGGNAPEPPSLQRPTDPFYSSHQPPPSHRRYRPRSVGRRNMVYMALITLVCIIVAGFLALMQHYASQVDIEAMKAKAEKSMMEQAKEQILKDGDLKEKLRKMK